MHELVTNLHIHSSYSDGSGSHADISNAASKAGLDAIIITDHNVLVQGCIGYRNLYGKRTIILVGEEIHDQGRIPQKNHLLVFGLSTEVATLAYETQHLVNFVKENGGLSFIAHPVDPELGIFNETDISWEDWGVTGFTGIELWNGLSEIKTIIKNRLGALIIAYFPQLLAHGPLPETILKWDDLLGKGTRVVAIAGADSHALHMRLGPIRKTIFPYKFHFSTLNNHLLTPSPLCGDYSTDAQMIYSALSSGHSFIGYDLPALTKGFRFSAQSAGNTAIMGDTLKLDSSITLQIHTPGDAITHLFKDGRIVASTRKENLVFTTCDTGVFRVEVYRRFLGKNRGWIYSNPIYIRS
jgi:hypothetical protein